MLEVLAPTPHLWRVEAKSWMVLWTRGRMSSFAVEKLIRSISWSRGSTLAAKEGSFLNRRVMISVVVREALDLPMRGSIEASCPILLSLFVP